MSSDFQKKNMVGDMLKFGLVPIVSALLTLIAVPIISNIYPVDEYGKITLFYTTGNILVLIFLFGMDQAYIRYFFEPPSRTSSSDIRSLSILLGVAVDLGISVICIVCAGRVIAECLFGEGDIFGLVCLSVYVLAQIVFRILNISARMQGMALQYGVQTIGQNLITKVAFIFAAFISTKYTYSILLMTIGMVVLVLVFLVKQRAVPSISSAQRAWGASALLLRYGVPCMVSNLIVNLNSYIGRLILGSGGLFDAVGIFSLAFTLSNLFSIFTTAFSLYWSPFMYKNYKEEHSFITQVHDLVMFAVAVIVILVALFQDVIFVMVGEKYRATQVVFMAMMIAPMITLVCETTAYGITIKEKPYLDVVATSVALGINLAVSIGFVPEYGIWGAVFGMVAGSLAMGALRTVFAQRLYRTIRHPWKTLFALLMVLGVCLGNAFLYDEILIRDFAAVAMLAIVVALYRDQIKLIYSKVKRKLFDGKC